MNSYSLIDSGKGRKLEQFGPFLISRPSAQALWHPQLSEKEWTKADTVFTRESDNRWIDKKPLPQHWVTEAAGIKFKISPTDFGHLGLFPEQKDFWEWIQTVVSNAIKSGRKEVRVLNLFAYSGGSTLAAAKAGAITCHLDASKGMVAWARENAALNNLTAAPIRWIVDDVNKFLAREIRRENRYDAIILDPPSFGRGSQGEVFKIEDDLPHLLSTCRQLLTPNPLFILFSCHTPGFTPVTMGHIIAQMMEGKKGLIDTGEMVLRGSPEVLPLPSGTFARWLDGGTGV
jgi:23S rRNA (cytosine1962-C5)-methyltransferase